MTHACRADGRTPGEIVFLSPDEGLRAELTLLHSVAEGKAGDGRLIWCTRECLVVPRLMARLPQFAEASAALKREGWPIYIRDTGGDVYPQGPGIVNIAIVIHLARDNDDRTGRAYSALCNPILDAMKEFGLSGRCAAVPGAFCKGSHDIAVEGRKCVGVAQRWRRAASHLGAFDAALIHAGLLCVGDMSPFVSLVNEFYERCGIDRRVECRSHRALFSGYDIEKAWDMTGQFIARIENHLDRKTGMSSSRLKMEDYGQVLQPAL
jgi:hypothetical protein